MPAALSVVILCYKSGNHIRDYVQGVIEALEKYLPSAWEIILVGNYLEGSDDKTPDVVRKIASADPRIKAVTMPKKGMMGWDAKSGLKEAKGDSIALIDGDGQIEASDLIRAHKKLKEGFDLVTAYRRTRYDGFIRRVISFFYNLAFNIFFPGPLIRDVNAKPKIITRSAYQNLKIKSDDWFLDAEIMLEARRLKLRVAEIPTVFYQSRYKPSLVKADAVFEFIRNMLSARIKRRNSYLHI
jgi:glycosyltransferase involved in cell wall biosynthesis